MKTMKLVAVNFLMLAGLNVSAGTVLTCTQTDSANKTKLVLNEVGNSRFTLDLYDPSAFQPLAQVNLNGNSVILGSRIISVDHWESHLGAVQLIAVFDAGAFKSKHFYLDARFCLDRDNHGSFGLKALTDLSTARVNWVCEEN